MRAPPPVRVSVRVLRARLPPRAADQSSVFRAPRSPLAQPSLATRRSPCRGRTSPYMNRHETPLHAITGASTHRATRLQNALAHARLPPPRRDGGVRSVRAREWHVGRL
eukprot:scaffold3533_cov53-Phaeocystis_antarctica.AAC.1